MRTLLYAIRWAIIIAVLLISRLHFEVARVQRRDILVAVAVMAILTLAIQSMPKSWTRWQKATLSAIADVALVTVIVYFSDGIQSPFFPLYYVTIMSVAAAYGTRGALIAALGVSVLSLGVEMHDTHGALTEGLVVEDVVRTLPYLFLAAVIAGLLSDRIRVLTEVATTLRAERAAIEHEMDLARRIQRAQLPVDTPLLPGVEVVTIYRPAREVGGDLYDFYPISEEHLGVVIADVAGKGVPAALLVASAKYAIREHFSDDLDQMMRGVDSHLLSVTSDDSFVTMLYGVLEFSSREFIYANAGHMPPMVVRASGEVTVVEYSDPPLGLGAAAAFAAQRFRLNHGDTLVLYTDGVTDALAAGSDSVEALRRLLEELDTSDLRAWQAELERRLENPKRLDDITVVAIRVS